jgi:hypothetical protein
MGKYSDQAFRLLCPVNETTWLLASNRMLFCLQRIPTQQQRQQQQSTTIRSKYSLQILWNELLYGNFIHSFI